MILRLEQGSYDRVEITLGIQPVLSLHSFLVGTTICLNKEGYSDGNSYYINCCQTISCTSLCRFSFSAQGGDGNWRPLAQALTGGYSQVEACVDSYLDKKAFYSLPIVPPSPAKAFGQEVILVSYAAGDVVGTPGYDKIKELDSFMFLETGVSVGCQVEHTVDLLTSVGSVILMHEDEEILKRDVNRIRDMEKNNELFDLKQSGRMMNAVSKLNLQSLSLTEDRFD